MLYLPRYRSSVYPLAPVVREPLVAPVAPTRRLPRPGRLIREPWPLTPSPGDPRELAEGRTLDLYA